MGRMSWVVKTDGQHEHVVFQIEEDGKSLGHMMLDGASAEKLAHAIGDSRSALNDPVTPQLDPNAILEAIPDPSWQIEAYRRPEGRLLALRHPGLGWLAFVIPDQQARRIAEWLTK